MKIVSIFFTSFLLSKDIMDAYDMSDTRQGKKNFRKQANARND